VSGFQLNWSDQASDEDGYLLEMKPSQRSEFAVPARLDRDNNAFGYAYEPPHRPASLRERAFYYGHPSNSAQITTGAAPSRNVSPQPKDKQPKAARPPNP